MYIFASAPLLVSDTDIRYSLCLNKSKHNNIGTTIFEIGSVVPERNLYKKTLNLYKIGLDIDRYEGNL